MSKTLNKSELAQFTGSESWYRHGINRAVRFTDGAKYVADQAGAYWLLDEIAIIQPHDARLRAEEFQVWKLAVNADPVPSGGIEVTETLANGSPGRHVHAGSSK